jgi:site-specific DNA recombinase
VRVPPLPKAAAIYTRVSTKEQAENGKTSPQTQQDGCRAWASANGFAVADSLLFHDSHTGEELWERPHLTRLCAAAKARQFAVVVCHSVDRLSRDPLHLGILLDEMALLDVEVQFVTEEVDDTPDGALVRFVKGYAAKIESERRKERTMRAVRARAQAGKLIPSSRPPYGYQFGPEVDGSGRLTKVRLVIDPATAPIVVRIFHDVVHGQSLRSVASALTQEGIPTPTGLVRWNPVTIRKIIALSTYWGQPVALRSHRCRWRSARAPPTPPA